MSKVKCIKQNYKENSSEIDFISSYRESTQHLKFYSILRSNAQATHTVSDVPVSLSLSVIERFTVVCEADGDLYNLICFCYRNCP